MVGIRKTIELRSVAVCRFLAASLILSAGWAGAQGPPAAAGDGSVQALFLSDIHFEPFFDPGKVPQLAAAPVSEWKGILAAAPSADRAKQFDALQQTCHARGEDTSFPLLESSLQAVRKNAAETKFATVSGDLISHAFTCKFAAVFPKPATGDYKAFVKKTLDFVMEEVDAALGGVAVYWALGNNDSDCGDYKLDAHSDFLAAVGEEAAKGFPAAERKSAKETFAAGGYFSARLPMENARILVLDDQFMGSKYLTCGDKPDESAADAQIAWLEQQLAEARRGKQKVWVMAHIPPGVDVHSSAAHPGDVCGEKGPKMFLASEKLADVLVEYSDVVQLAIFAHTHMDELRILRGAKPGQGVAVKMVSSISPINGNAPSFTVARVGGATAGLEDYKVFAASNTSGVDTAWREEYDWGKTFGEGEFSAAGVSKVVAGFAADPGAKTQASRDYIHNFFVGNENPLLSRFWPQYVCSLQNDSVDGFKACVCPAGGAK